MISKKLGFIGAGNMAQAIGFSLFNSGEVEGKEMIISAPSMRNLSKWEFTGAHVTFDNNDVITLADVIFLAIKPQYLDVTLDSFKKFEFDLKKKVFISILAGVVLEVLHQKLSNALGQSPLQVVRVMPNTPILVGCGFSAICHNQFVSDESLLLVKRILSIGGVCELLPEHLFNGFSAVCGSGPAFVCLMIEALSDVAVKRGIPREMAQRMAAYTVEGAAKLVISGHHPAVLKDQVCSPGGTTIAGIYKLETKCFRGLIMEAVEAAAARGDELSATIQ